MDFVRPQYLAHTLLQSVAVISVLENNKTYANQNPKGEPQLGRRGLYRGYPHGGVNDLALLWVLNMSDGSHALLDIAERAGIAFADVRKAAEALGNQFIKTDPRLNATVTDYGYVCQFRSDATQIIVLRKKSLYVNNQPL